MSDADHFDPLLAAALDAQEEEMNARVEQYLDSEFGRLLFSLYTEQATGPELDYATRRIVVGAMIQTMLLAEQEQN